MFNKWKYLWILLSILFALILMLPVILNSLDLNQFKEAIETKVTELTGRQLKINGDLQLKLSLHPFIRIEKVSFANAAWSKQQPQMLAFDLLQLQIELLPLLKKQLLIDQLQLQGLVLVVEKNIDGQTNWLLQKLAGDASRENETGAESTSFNLSFMPVFNQLQIDGSHIYYADVKADIETRINIETLRLSHATMNQPFNFRANGSINKHPFNFNGETNIPAAATISSTKADVLNHELNSKALFVKLNANAIGATLSANGMIESPVTDNGIGIDIEVSLVAADLNKTFSAATGKSLKQLSINTMRPLPLQLSARLTNRTGIYQLSAIKFSLADSDLSGEVSFNSQSTQPKIQAELHSKKVNINQLLAKPAIQSHNNKIKSANKNTGIELPDTPLPFGLLESINANIKYSARQIAVDDFTVKAVKLNAALQEGRLQVEQFDFNLDKATVRSNMSIYSASVNKQSKTPAVNAHINIKNLDLSPLAKRFKTTQLQQGKLTATIKLKSRGDNVRSLLLALHGKANIKLNQLKARQQINHQQHNIYIETADLSFLEMNAPIKYAIKGAVDNEKISLSGELTTLSSLLNNRTTAISAKIITLESDLSIDGRIKKPLVADTAQIDIALTIPETKKSFNRLSRLLPEINSGNTVPDLPVSLKAQLNISPDNIHASKIKLNIGNNDLSGEVNIDTGKNKPFISADISSQLLDIDSLLPAKNTENNVKPVQQNTKKDNKLFSTGPLPSLETLDRLNATVHYQLKNLTANNQNIQNLSVDLILDEGQLQLKPLTLEIAGGSIISDLKLSKKESLQFQTNIVIHKLDYDRLMAIMGTKEYARGELDAEINLHSTGNSVSALMAGLNGKIRITTEDGYLNSPALKLLSTDLVSLIPFTDNSDKQKIRCAVMQLDIDNGIAKTHALVIDTGTVSALAAGEINLATETLSLHVQPRSKRTSVMKLALVPLNVEGSLASPSITPDVAGTTISTTTTAANFGLAFATGGISLLAEGLTNELWKQFIDDTDYCALALAGKKVVPTLIKLRDSDIEGEIKKSDADYIEELDDDYGGF